MGMERFETIRPFPGRVTQDDIPQTPPRTAAVQPFDMRTNDVYNIFDERRLTYTPYQVQKWVKLGGEQPLKVVRLHAPTEALELHLTYWQIDYLQKRGRIIPVSAVAPEGEHGRTPGYGLSLTGKPAEKASRYLEYIEVAEKHLVDKNDGKPSRKILTQAVKDLAALRGEAPPSISVIYDKMKKLRIDRNFDPLAAVADEARPGNRSKRKPGSAEAAIREAVEEAISINGNWHDVKALLYAWSQPDGKYSEFPNLVRSEGVADPVFSDRTIQRRLAEVDRYTRDVLRHGDEYADRKYADRLTQLRPRHVLDIVDVDHTTLDVVVFGEGISFGRPDLIIFRDRFSGTKIGWHVSFGPPSYETFLNGFLHAISPKDPESLPASVESYPYHGLPLRLGVDNAKHLIGVDTKAAARQLGMQTVAYRPGHPWEKGALERLFGILNIQLIHKLPGTTTNSPDERKKYDEDKNLALPHIELAELNGFLAYYFAEIDHQTPHLGLGPVPGTAAVPADLWEAGISSMPARPIQDYTILARLAGEAREVGITDSGLVRWGLEYQSAQLNALKLSASHKPGQGKFHGTKYRATRDPSDMSRIWVEVPGALGQHIEVPVSGAYAEYARGLTLSQHRMIVKHYREKSTEAANATRLMKAKAELTQTLVDVHNRRKKHGTATKLARFLAKQSARIEFSRPVILAEEEQGARLNLAHPKKVERKQPRSPLARARMPAPKTPKETDDFDLDTNDRLIFDQHETPSLSSPDGGDFGHPGVPSIDDIAVQNDDWED